MKTMNGLLLTLSTVALFTACQTSSPTPSYTPPDWDAMVERVAPSLMGAALQRPSSPLWKSPQTGEEVYYWASVGKSWTAVLVMQLFEKEVLHPDDKLSTWFPSLKNADQITLDHLLSHTSGIYSFQEAQEFRERTRFLEPLELVNLAETHPRLFTPGAGWSYSNTGYVLLGLILEHVTGKTYSQLVADNITTPLGLTHTRALPLGDSGSLVRPIVTPESAIPFNPSQPFSAGCIIAPPHEMLAFWRALQEGKLVSQHWLKWSQELQNPFYSDTNTLFGRGTILLKFQDKAGRDRRWIAHLGGTPGAQAVVAWDVDERVYVAVAALGEAPVVAVALALIDGQLQRGD